MLPQIGCPGLHFTYRVVLELCHPRPGVGVVNVDDRIVLLLAVQGKQTRVQGITPLLDHAMSPG